MSILKKLTPIIILVLVFHDNSAQELLLKTSLKLSPFKVDSRETYFKGNAENSELALFVINHKSIQATLLDNNFESKSKFETPKSSPRFKTMLGSSVKNDTYYLYFATEKKHQFFIKSINFTEKKSTVTEPELTLKREKFLQVIEHENKFFMLTIKTKSSILRLYEFVAGEIILKKEFDFAKYFGDLLHGELASEDSIIKSFVNLIKIDTKIPNSLDLTANDFKLYKEGEQVYLTMDRWSDKTGILFFNLHTYTHGYETFQMPKTVCGYQEPKANSYLYRGKLHQLKVCKNALSYSITDFETKSVSYEYQVNKEEKITFTNSAFIQDGGLTIFSDGVVKELQETKKVLKRISNGNVGVSVIETTEGMTEITLGSYEEARNTGGGGGFSVVPGGTLSTPGGPVPLPDTYIYNPTTYGYNSYGHSRSVYFNM